MAKVKGTGRVFLRKLVNGCPSARAAVETVLTKQELLAFDTVQATDWQPIDEEGLERLYVAALPRVFPDDPEPYERFGREMARAHFPGVYSMVFRVLTPSFLVSQCTKAWRLYHDRGELKSALTGERAARLELRSYPIFPEKLRQVTTGYYLEAAAMTGARNVRATASGDPSCWTWDIRWE